MNPNQMDNLALGCNHNGDSPEIVILGIGNLLWADEGFGVRCVERLQRDYEFTPDPLMVDGGTQGLYLVHYVQMAKRLLIFDAIDYGLEPGTLKEIRDEEVPKFMGAKKMSLHQTGFQEVLSLATFTGNYPESVLLIGCQPEYLEDYGGSLRPSVRKAMDRAIELGLEALASWGCVAKRRTKALSTEEMVTLPHLDITRYEEERPSEDEACRVGDSRFFPGAIGGIKETG